MSNPRVAVLLASFNGATFIAEQIRSILECRCVQSHIFLSDDDSSDQTVEVARAAGGDRVSVLPSSPQGSAGQNFIRLMKDAPWEEFDYVALSDQDDIWLPNKLDRAIAVLAQGHDAYSSDVTAFWPDNRRRYVRKSQRQRRWDYLFEGGGPGNTFVWPQAEANFLRSVLSASDQTLLSRIGPHDWLFYAIFRAAQKKWCIDEFSGLEYRQHSANVMGASSGLRATKARLKMLRSGWYRTQIMSIAALTGEINRPDCFALEHVRRPTLLGAVPAAFQTYECRRSKFEAILLAALFLALPFARGT